MNKKISQIALIALFITLVLPNLAMASWWNPFSWGWFHKTARIETVQVTTNTATTTKIVATTTPIKPPITKSKEVKIVTPAVVINSSKTVSLQNSEACKSIEELYRGGGITPDRLSVARTAAGCPSGPIEATVTPIVVPVVPPQTITGLVSATSTTVLGCDGVASIKDDRDVNNPVYEIVKIGKQCWTKRNLNIGIQVTEETPQANNNVIEKYCYNDVTSKCNSDGGLYQYDEAINYRDNTNTVQGICPTGWHIPSESDWEILATYLGGTNRAGEKMKDRRFNTVNPNRDPNTSGFSAIGSGRRDDMGTFQYSNDVAFFWSSSPASYPETMEPEKNAIYYTINSNEIQLNRTSYFRSSAVSVRCVKN